MTQEKITEIIIHVMITNKRGLHARASARFVACVEQFKETTVTVSKDDYTVTGDSIMGLMMLGAACGTSITIKVTSHNENQAQETIDALTNLLQNKFGETE